MIQWASKRQKQLDKIITYKEPQASNLRATTDFLCLSAQAAFSRGMLPESVCQHGRARSRGKERGGVAHAIFGECENEEKELALES